MPRRTAVDERFWVLAGARARASRADLAAAVLAYASATPARRRRALAAAPLRRATEHEPGTGAGTAQFWALAGALLRGRRPTAATIATALRDFARDMAE